MSRPFRYILRYLIDPEFDPVARTAELVEFCREAKVAEVMLLLCAEELSAGHPTPQEIDSWIEMASRIRRELQNEGIAMSLNPWSTVYHNQRGRILREGQNFRQMVGENGVASSVSVCPLCENWQEYLVALFVRFAREITPVALWVEDDWRLHNHDRAALGWGGCFCDHHLGRFSERVGHSVSRADLLAAVLQEGQPHPWRRLWMDLSRETLEGPLSRLTESLRSIAPEMRIGIMTSDPDQHSLEGRDWGALRKVTAGKGRLLLRPHLPPYTQENPFYVPPSVTRHTIACLDEPADVYPELENSPRCGPYSKSKAYTRWQMIQSALYGSDGITINHFDMLGNGTALDEGFGRGLRVAKPMLDALAELEISDRMAEGVSVLFDTQIAHHFELSRGAGSFSALAPHSVFWSRVFYTLGVTHRLCGDPGECGGLIAVSGQTLRGMNDDQIAWILSRNVLLDAGSVRVLWERGLAEFIGLSGCEWRTLEQSAFSYERVAFEGEVFRMTAQRCDSRLLDMSLRDGAEVLSTIHDASHRRLWPGATQYENALGGRVVCLCYPLEPVAQFSMGFFNVFRRRFIQRLVFRLARGEKLAAVDSHPVHAYRVATKRGTVLAACSVSDDPASEIVWRVPVGEFLGTAWSHLDLDGEWSAVEPVRMPGAENDVLVFPFAIPALGDAVLLAKPL